MFSKKLFCVVAMLIGMVASFGAYAQNLTVRGTVKDASGPVVGAVVLSGGAAMLYGLAETIEEVLKIPCRVAQEPRDCVALGCGRILTEPNTLRYLLKKQG